MTTIELMAQQTHYFQTYCEVNLEISHLYLYISSTSKISILSQGSQKFIYFENIQITYIFASKQISLVAEISAEINEFSVANLQSDHLDLWMSTPGNRI